ncbi:ran binding domain-containing protein [Rhizoctonia solani AG-1 IA]|uniref:Ran binding domain-containing protein n=1 Tax=Thanatephorus cucumeris (strain AG1-IA) TaxID=983506 RepID=L8X6T9_THACA|nr:ran binding domain-containing protein [Rhizoctonia solani AG-1 IA]
MLGPSPESSLAAPYLSMSRREAVADQVNSAMLWYVGEAPAPRLQIWAQTAKVVWDQVAAMHAPMPRIDEIPVDVRMYARYVVRSTEGEDQVRKKTWLFLLIFTRWHRLEPRKMFWQDLAKIFLRIVVDCMRYRLMLSCGFVSFLDPLYYQKFILKQGAMPRKR